jgi:hypothetical protein
MRIFAVLQEITGKKVQFPLWALPWLRELIAKMLAKHYGSEQICKIPKIPE